MQNYIRYEIETRKFSSNVIVGVYEYTDENGKTKEKRDIVICPTLKKEDGDIYADNICKQLNNSIVVTTFTELVKKGFICEIVSDAWANWQFNEQGKPIYSTAKPLYYNVDKFDDVRSVCWRGIIIYFNKEGKLMQDDTGCYDNDDNGYMKTVNQLVKAYENLKHNIDPNGFNNNYKK